MKICFVSDTHYPKYVSRLKKHALNSYFKSGLDKLGVNYYISTNCVNDLNDINNANVKVFDIDILRANHESLNLEILPEDPTGIYPRWFPWNLERFIYKKAIEDGFDYIINLDADVLFKEVFDSPESMLSYLESLYELNVIATNQAIFSYKNRSPSEVFHLHEKYFSQFNITPDEDKLNSLDGPVVALMGNQENLNKFVDNWDELTVFGYKKEYGYGYDTNVCGNWSLAIAMSDFTLKWKDFPFYPDHKVEDRP